MQKLQTYRSVGIRHWCHDLHCEKNTCKTYEHTTDSDCDTDIMTFKTLQPIQNETLMSWRTLSEQHVQHLQTYSRFRMRHWYYDLHCQNNKRVQNVITYSRVRMRHRCHDLHSQNNTWKTYAHTAESKWDTDIMNIAVSIKISHKMRPEVEMN